MSADIVFEVIGDDEPLSDYSTLLSQAFAEYPVMRNAFAHAPGVRTDWIKRLMGRALFNRRAMGIPCFSAKRDGKPVGVAVLSMSDRETPPELIEGFTAILSEAGPEATAFFDGFLSAVDSVSLPAGHVWIAILGVLPELQGQGIARALIDHVADFGRANPIYTGLGLDTEDDRNVTIYEKCGFRVLGQSSVGDMPVYVMWRDL